MSMLNFIKGNTKRSQLTDTNRREIYGGADGVLAALRRVDKAAGLPPMSVPSPRKRTRAHVDIMEGPVEQRECHEHGRQPTDTTQVSGRSVTPSSSGSVTPFSSPTSACIASSPLLSKGAVVEPSTPPPNRKASIASSSFNGMDVDKSDCSDTDYEHLALGQLEPDSGSDSDFEFDSDSAHVADDDDDGSGGDDDDDDSNSDSANSVGAAHGGGAAAGRQDLPSRPAPQANVNLPPPNLNLQRVVDALCSSPPPAWTGFRSTLKEHQRVAVKHMLTRVSTDGVGTQLFDAMGLGKTVTALAVMCGIRLLSDVDEAAGGISSVGKLPFLIVVPKSVLEQWFDEIVTHTTLESPYSDHHILIFRGASRSTSYAHLKTYQFIIATRHVLDAEMKKFINGNGVLSRHRSALFPRNLERQAYHGVYATSQNKKMLDFIRSQAESYGDSLQPRIRMHPFKKRFDEWIDDTESFESRQNARFAAIFIDEAHLLRNYKSVMCRAALVLSRLCGYQFNLTGTPFNNKAEDVATLARIVADRELWSSTSNKAVFCDNNKGPGHHDRSQMMARWRRSIVLRGKDHIADSLPHIERKVYSVAPTDEEQLYSAHLYRKLRTAFILFQNQKLPKNRFTAFSWVLTCLLRLLQSTTHRLTIAGRTQTHQYARKSEARVKRECVKCCARNLADEVDRAVAIDDDDNDDHVHHVGGRGAGGSGGEKTPIADMACGHTICAPCYAISKEVARKEGGGEPKCVLCAELSELGMAVEKGGKLPPRSSKLDALIKALRNDLVQYRDPHFVVRKEKAVVFSIFTAVLDLVEPFLIEAGISYLRYDGDLSDTKRPMVITDFMQGATHDVLLISTHAGGMGLNLTRANRVYFLDRWYNPAVEDQAADRIHRIGQEHACTITWLQIANSMDDAIQALQEKKRSAAKLTLTGVGSINGVIAGGINAEDVDCIMRALDIAYRPVIEKDNANKLKATMASRTSKERDGTGKSSIDGPTPSKKRAPPALNHIQRFDHDQSRRRGSIAPLSSNGTKRIRTHLAHFGEHDSAYPSADRSCRDMSAAHKRRLPTWPSSKPTTTSTSVWHNGQPTTGGVRLAPPPPVTPPPSANAMSSAFGGITSYVSDADELDDESRPRSEQYTVRPLSVKMSLLPKKGGGGRY